MFLVFVAVAVMSLCYWITVDVSKLKLVGTVRVKCSLDVAFYMVIGAGIAAVTATTLSLLQITCEKKERRHRHRDSDMQLQLMYHQELDDMPPFAPPVYQP